MYKANQKLEPALQCTRRRRITGNTSESAVRVDMLSPRQRNYSRWLGAVERNGSAEIIAHEAELFQTWREEHIGDLDDVGAADGAR